MPSSTKTLYFMGSALITAVSVGLLGFSMSTDWAVTTLLCSREGTNLFNGSAVISLALFNGILDKDFCPIFGGHEEFEVMPTLVSVGAAAAALHAVSLCLLALCLLFSACNILISLYNSVSNPYETYLGPAGVYACSAINCCLSVLVLILFALNVNVTNLAEGVVRFYSEATPVELKGQVSEMQVGYYLLIPFAALSLAALGVIYSYEHAAYRQRKEQQRPTEDAPKEIMMY